MYETTKRILVLNSSKYRQMLLGLIHFRNVLIHSHKKSAGSHSWILPIITAFHIPCYSC